MFARAGTSAKAAVTSQARRFARWAFGQQPEGPPGRPPTANTHARKGTSGRHPGRLQAASLEPSKRCSRMPLIGLVRLRRAQGGVIPPFDPIHAIEAIAGRWATRKRRQAGNGLTTCYRVKVGMKVRLGGRVARAQPVPHT